jgi:hypothetical protein
MHLRQESRALLALLLAAVLGCTPAHGIVTLNFNDGHDHVYVTGSLSASHDSNIYAHSSGAGDFIYSTTLTAEYVRRAGWIGVNANAGVSSSHFATIRGQDFSNPTFGLEFTKQSGRTTGSFTLNAARESRADSAVNVRTTAWTYNAGLNFAYPIIERFKMAGQLGYSAHRYIDETNLVNLSTYSAGVNLYYVYNTERDLSAGYRYRYTQSSASQSSTDHNFTVGMSGRLIRGLRGAVTVGYQIRVPHGPLNQPVFHGVSASGSTSYAINRKVSLSGAISKDFSTTATDSSVDTTAANLDLQYAYSSRWGVMLGSGWGQSRFLGPGGRMILQVGPPTLFGPNRQDDFFHWDASLNYARSERFKVSFTYGWFKNWSTASYADFVRSSWNVNLNSRL